MKKTALILIALFCGVVSVSASEAETANNLYTHHYDFRDFRYLSISNAFRVDLTFTDEWSLDIEVPDFIEPYLNINCSGEKLRIGLVNLPRDIQRKLNDSDRHLYAKIKMPTMYGLKLSGACRVRVEGTPAFKSSEAVSIEMSGASKLEDFKAACDLLKLDMSGASSATIKADFKKMDIDISGASKIKMDGTAEYIEMECSGASSAKLNGKYVKAAIEVNGASKVNMQKIVEFLGLEVSGASNFETEENVASADVELSGASKARIGVTERLNYELSGVSTLRVRESGAKIRGEASRGSKIVYIK